MNDSLQRLPEGKQRQLAFVVKTIRDGFAFAIARRTMPALRGGKLLKIILFGSYARGDWVEDPVGRYFSDYDLLVVVDREELTDVPEFWTKREKLAWLDENVMQLGRQNALNTIEWEELRPDKRNTWILSEFNEEFLQLMPFASKEAKLAGGLNVQTLFGTYSPGVKTGRDTTVYDFNLQKLGERIQDFSNKYNFELDRYKRAQKPVNIDDFVQYGELKWSLMLKEKLQRGKYIEVKNENFRSCIYRPFVKMNLYYDGVILDAPGLHSQFLPKSLKVGENVVIWLKVGSAWPMFALASYYLCDQLPQGGSQCFPFYVYDTDGTNRRENITDWALAQFRAHYGDESISKWDIFYYVYGLLHHPEYRERYADNLKRELPRIPFVPSPPAPSPTRGEGEKYGFWAFSEAGKKLADLHLNYETVKPYALEWVTKPGVPVSYRVEKMRLGPMDDHVEYTDLSGKTMKVPLGELRVNDTLKLQRIPPEVQDYKLGNRSALAWIVDQYQVSSDKRSGITSDPNGYSDDERYIVDLVEKVVRVSVDTVAIVRGLQQLAFR